MECGHLRSTTLETVLYSLAEIVSERSLYYFQRKDIFIFASELSSFECFPSFDREISNIALSKYLAHGYIPAPHSLLKNVYKLNAGSNLLFNLSTNQKTIKRYWEFILDPDPIGKRTEDYYAEGLLSLLRDSVRSRLVSDVPIGTFLSGGIDSSSITKLAKDSVSKLETFNIGFEDQSFDESKFAKESADFIERNTIPNYVPNFRCWKCPKFYLRFSTNLFPIVRL